MDEKLQRYYEDRFSMFASQGWFDLLEDAQNIRQSIDKVSSIKTTEDLYFKQGQLDILDWLLTLKAMSEKVYEDLQHESNE
ncbi:MAG: hypothetical protein EBR30_23920 [Cytophagia bacterium]|jgi:hypothetical protein|nr:hypothetical protein [Cytophagia bacterium]